MYFRPKLAWPPAIDNAISRNHSNWPSLNLSQNLREVWANSYWKRQVLMFYPLGKDSEKPKGDGIPPPLPPPLYVRGLKVCKTILSLMTINFLLLRKYASPLSFCYRWSLLPKCALSNRNRSKSGTNLEKCHICQLIYWPRDLPTSFSLNNLLLGIYIFAAYLFGANLCKSILSSSVVRCQNSNFCPFRQLSQL